MGSRASYVVTKDGETQAYGSHWGATSLVNQLFAGPEHATATFEASFAMDNVAEIIDGGEACALVDWDNRKLWWWSTHCELPMQRRLYNRLLDEIWAGWEVNFALGGYDDLLRELNVTVERDDVFDNDDDFDPSDEHEFDNDMMAVPRRVTGPVDKLYELNTGCWLTVRDTDGKTHDYFLRRGVLDEDLEGGPALLEHVKQFPELQSPPPELSTVDGIVIDVPDKTIWRWAGPRQDWSERRLKRAWKGWFFRDFDGEWTKQMELTGRKAGDLIASDRAILGASLAPMLVPFEFNQETIMQGVDSLWGKLQRGCLTVVLAFAVLGGGLAYALRSKVFGVIVGVFVFQGLRIWYKLWRKKNQVVDQIQRSSVLSESAAAPPGPTKEEREARINAALVSLGYPTIQDLRSSGELRDVMDENDEDDDED